MIMNDIKTIIRIVLYSISNLIVRLLGLIISRDKKVVLFGAWMGQRYADNSRFLFQYLCNNKDRLGLKKIIWITRNSEINEKLNRNGFESYLVGTRESRYWHLKSGIHIICNMPAKSGDHYPDIDVRYSTGAKKIQLWHGVGIKAVGATANSGGGKRSSWVVNFANKEIIRKIGFLGEWGEPKILCTSELNKKINLGNSKIHPQNAFLSMYPRYGACNFLFEDEKRIIKTIRDHSISVLFLPTFRDGKSSFVFPTNNEGFNCFLAEHDILWIQKLHQADIERSKTNDNKNILNLETSFDINTILRTVDIIVSDYSSAAFDAIFLKKPVVMYVPDIDEFMNGPNGLLIDLRELCPSLLARDIDELRNMILSIVRGIYFTEERKELLSKMRSDFFSDKQFDYDTIWKDICEAISSEK